MTAADRLAALDTMPAAELCALTGSTLDELCRAMNEETTLMRAGRYREASPFGAEKTRLAQDYVGLVRAVQRQSGRLVREAPTEVKRLRAGHEQLATQLAENLRVIATARHVTETLLGDVAAAVGQNQRAKTYGSGGEMNAPAPVSRGIAVNKAL
jgi:hypothetical protein